MKRKVISLFHGMGCIGLALSKIGINQFDLYASEVDKYATKVSDALFPDTINIGDVRFVMKAMCWKISTIEKVFKSQYICQQSKDKIKALLYLRDIEFDLCVAGSPCQGFSFAGKQLNFKDSRSKLFFDFVRILEACKKKNPNIKFLLENVRMKKEYERIISDLMNVMPLKINSALLSAQNRVRLYWTNIGSQFQKAMFQPISSAIPQPKDKGILLKNILELDVDEKYYLSSKMIQWLIGHSEKRGTKVKVLEGHQKTGCLTASVQVKQNLSTDYIKCAAMRGRYKIGGKRQDAKGSIAGKSTQEIEIRKDDKTNCLTSVQKDNLVIQLNQSKESGGKQPYQHNRVYSVDGKSPCLNTDSRRNILQVPEATKKGFAEIKDGECFDNTFPDSKTRRGRKMENKSNCLTASKYDFCQFKDMRIRRLTPRECAKLQTIQEWAIEIILNCGVSDSQLYKMFGNGWTVDVVAYILSYLIWD